MRDSTAQVQMRNICVGTALQKYKRTMNAWWTVLYKCNVQMTRAQRWPLPACRPELIHCCCTFHCSCVGIQAVHVVRCSLTSVLPRRLPPRPLGLYRCNLFFVCADVGLGVTLRLLLSPPFGVDSHGVFPGLLLHIFRSGAGRS